MGKGGRFCWRSPRALAGLEWVSAVSRGRGTGRGGEEQQEASAPRKGENARDLVFGNAGKPGRCAEMLCLEMLLQVEANVSRSLVAEMFAGRLLLKTDTQSYENDLMRCFTK